MKRVWEPDGGDSCIIMWKYWTLLNCPLKMINGQCYVYFTTTKRKKKEWWFLTEVPWMWSRKLTSCMSLGIALPINGFYRVNRRDEQDWIWGAALGDVVGVWHLVMEKNSCPPGDAPPSFQREEREWRWKEPAGTECRGSRASRQGPLEPRRLGTLPRPWPSGPAPSLSACDGACVWLTPPGLATAPLGSYLLFQHIPCFLVPSHTCNLKIHEPHHGLLPGDPILPLLSVTISTKTSLASPRCSLVFQQSTHHYPYHRECHLFPLFHKILSGYLLSARHSSKALGG